MWEDTLLLFLVCASTFVLHSETFIRRIWFLFGKLILAQQIAVVIWEKVFAASQLFVPKKDKNDFLNCRGHTWISMCWQFFSYAEKNSILRSLYFPWSYKVTQKVLLVLVTFYSFSGEADKKVDLCYEIGLFPSEWQTYSPKSRKRWSEEAPSLQGYLRHDDLLLIFTRVKLSKSGLAWLKDPGISKRGMGRRLKFYEMCSGVRL